MTWVNSLQELSKLGQCGIQLGKIFRENRQLIVMFLSTLWPPQTSAANVSNCLYWFHRALSGVT
uniref:Uncharacterized protein n=1 Tax=Rhizophora mucronata TaxID=61149 RepID=A0A2P2N576_RHIMU